MSKHLHISREGSTEYEYWNRVDLLEEEEPEPTTGLRVDGNQLRDENQQVLLNGVVHPYASTGLDKYVGWLQGIQKGQTWSIRPELADWYYEDIASKGFNCILSMISWKSWVDNEAFEGVSYRNRLGRKSELSAKYGMYHILSITRGINNEHPWKPLATSTKQQYVAFCKSVATYYAGKHPTMMFCLGQEPGGGGGITWLNWQREAVREWRKIDDRLLIVTPSTWKNHNDVVANPVTGTNIAYGWHSYGHSVNAESYSGIKQEIENKWKVVTSASMHPVINTEYGFAGDSSRTYVSNLSKVMHDVGFAGHCFWVYDGAIGWGADMLVGGDSKSGWTTLSSEGQFLQNLIWSQPSRI